jgi:hypothetical protein
MAFVVTLSNFRPVPRFDGVKWNGATIQEATTDAGPWTDVETFTIASYPDAAAPPELSFTTDQATLDPSLGWFRLEFQDASSNVSYSPPLGPSGYPTTEDLVADSLITELTSLSESDQDALRETSINAVEEFCNQSFTYAPATTYMLDGTGTGVLYLPRRLIRLTSIDIPESSISMSELVLNDINDRLIVHVGPTSLGYYQTAIRELGDNWPMRFPVGAGNITVTGDWGWDSVPERVKIAIRKDMEDTALADANGLSQTARAFRKMGMRDISQGNLRASITGAYGLSPEVMGLLDRYVWMGSLGAVV